MSWRYGCGVCKGTRNIASSTAKRTVQEPKSKSRCKSSSSQFSPQALLVIIAPGYYFGERVLHPEVESMALERRVFDLDLCRGAAWTEVCWICFVRKRRCVLYKATGVSSLLRGTRRRIRPRRRPPIKSTGLEIELTKLTVSS